MPAWLVEMGGTRKRASKEGKTSLKSHAEAR